MPELGVRRGELKPNKSSFFFNTTLGGGANCQHTAHSLPMREAIVQDGYGNLNNLPRTALSRGRKKNREREIEGACTPKSTSSSVGGKCSVRRTPLGVKAVYASFQPREQAEGERFQQPWRLIAKQRRAGSLLPAKKPMSLAVGVGHESR